MFFKIFLKLTQIITEKCRKCRQQFESMTHPVAFDFVQNTTHTGIFQKGHLVLDQVHEYILKPTIIHKTSPEF